ncbi:delta(1)-pyrroline-2-carboxylate reductase family protein [Ideonella sp. BN130291]|uniref:delta(1)-pyrroline-2-carboxylate reductase family protein n=1 Tax=Ideonella sp. BN130291 TaxID=3112940 RepID=UPI002E26DD3B|nr:delta(1)-pyrroline-2-carboxylate reductase family protein [Ideonella sp. BN130291]
MKLLDAAATARALPWPALMAAIEQVLAAQHQGQVQVPERSVHSIAPDTRWFLMPAWSTPEAGGLAIMKLITYNAQNPARGLAAILGDVLVLRTDTGERLALLDGPVLTARRTAAVTAIAARRLAAQPGGPLLMFGAGAQALAHLQVFHEVLGVRELWLRSRGAEGEQRLMAAAQALGVTVHRATDLDAALARCPLVICATPANTVCMDRPPRDDAFVAAIGGFTTAMAEVAAPVVQHIAARGRVVLDTARARHEAGEVAQAGLDGDALPLLGEVTAASGGPAGPVLFKSCGAALWDLAAAHCAVGAPG